MYNLNKDLISFANSTGKKVTDICTLNIFFFTFLLEAKEMHEIGGEN